MTETYYPTTEQLIDRQQTVRKLLTGALVATVIIVFGTLGGILLIAPRIPTPLAWLLALLVFVCMALPVVIWNKPKLGVYLLFVAAMMFGATTQGTEKVTIPTQFIPFWWNISVIGQRWGTHALDALVFNPAEIVMVLTGAAWITRAVVKRDVGIRLGSFFWVIGAYLAFVMFGWIRGISSGGDTTIALNEIRSQTYFLYAYLLAANVLRDRKDIVPLIWIIGICVGIQGIFGTITYISKGGVVDENGIMGHDDSLLFNMLFFVVFLAWLTRANKRLTWITTLLVPFAVLATLANGRRASIAAFLMALIPLVPLVWATFRERRTAAVRFAVGIALVSAIYLPLAWNASGPWALPARALRSASDPNSRDAASNSYRDIENLDLKTTRNASPWIGIGYGKEFFQPIALPAVNTPLLHFMPHNGVLWVWMRLGNLGFFSFIMIFVVVLIRGTQIVKTLRDPWVKFVCLLALVHMLMLFTYGKYDLQFVNGRQMVAAAMLVGVLGVSRKLDEQTELEDAAALREAGRPERARSAISYS